MGVQWERSEIMGPAEVALGTANGNVKAVLSRLIGIMNFS